jgi:serine/threonine protein kinase
MKEVAERYFQEWTFEKCVGQGSQGSVWKARRRGRLSASSLSQSNNYFGETAAIKISERTDDAEREYELMQRLEHPFIVQVFDGHVSETVVTMAMSCADCTMLDRLQKQPDGAMTESMARTYFMQMLSAVAYLHNVEHVVHKDIKLENVLVQRDADRCLLVDFGFARRFVPGKRRLQDHCASMHYAAPEIWHGLRYEGPSVDIWALGVTLYALATGYLPFGAEDMASAYRDVEALRTRGLWLPDTMSTELKHLLRSCMLVYDMEKRASLDDVRAHPWIANALALPMHRLCQHQLVYAARQRAATVNVAAESLESLRKASSAQALYAQTLQAGNATRATSPLSASSSAAPAPPVRLADTLGDNNKGNSKRERHRRHQSRLRRADTDGALPLSDASQKERRRERRERRRLERRRRDADNQVGADNGSSETPAIVQQAFEAQERRESQERIERDRATLVAAGGSTIGSLRQSQSWSPPLIKRGDDAIKARLDAAHAQRPKPRGANRSLHTRPRPLCRSKPDRECKRSAELDEALPQHDADDGASSGGSSADEIYASSSTGSTVGLHTRFARSLSSATARWLRSRKRSDSSPLAASLSNSHC